MRAPQAMAAGLIPEEPITSGRYYWLNLAPMKHENDKLYNWLMFARIARSD